MSNDASGQESSADDVEPTTDTGDDTTDGSESADVKDRFLDALKRKQANNQDKANSGARGEAKVHEVHRSTTNKRRFRRKSG